MAGPVLVPILGDQLTRTLASLRGRTKDDTVILMMEVREEATYVKHHKIKIALIFSAMRHFAAELEDAGWSVDYVALTDDGNTHSFSGEVERAVKRHSPREMKITESGEWRVQQAMKQWAGDVSCPVEILDDDRFLCSIPEFFGWAQGRKSLRMENFYREMRRKTGLLMDGDGPEGGEWNYDKENRAPPDKDMSPPDTPKFSPDEITCEVMALVESEFGDHFGKLDNFGWPVTSSDADKALEAFIEQRLPSFGKYQDAMVHGSDDLFHSMLSTSINLGILDPVECCEKAEEAYRNGKAPLNAVEGFIRQIIGWREYIRGMYWLEMPELAEANALDANRPLPDFYWTGETDMRCMADCVRSTRDNAHAHHIQRLMILGNFALIAGVTPQEVEAWFLVVYADAYEWVELPNVAAMALHADGGKLATKPYAASGNYINKMSDYCKKCHYSPAKKTGEGACPFNPLYWDFMVRNRKFLEKNPRVSRVFSTWDRMTEDKRGAYLDSAQQVLERLKPAKPGWARD
ncbi:cryptochrome/photolyase family protein [Altererythrobacter aquiaggeris]|uniref:cryptochrome/photolyase family protein n=1 Tax=Aestuarierythrobacter aquiaggeris TaxID=1898396 RepID=UPI00301B0E3A